MKSLNSDIQIIEKYFFHISRIFYNPKIVNSIMFLWILSNFMIRSVIVVNELVIST